MIVARIKGAVAAEEARKTSQRLKRKHLEVARNGRFNGGIRRFGFEKDGLTINEPEAAMIRDLAHRVLQGESLYSFARHWEAGEIRPVKGGEWRSSTLRQMLLNTRLAG